MLNIKYTRIKVEYCWTCTPSTIDHVLKNFHVDNCTYPDADLFFYDSPRVLLEEMRGQKSGLITEHRFSKIAKIHGQKKVGRFYVQFVAFTNGQKSRKVLTTWEKQCIAWCYARYEDGKFGDQKHLDECPVRYENVQVLQHLGGNIATWNVRQKIIQDGKSLFGYDKKTKKRFKVIFLETLSKVS